MAFEPRVGGAALAATMALGVCLSAPPVQAGYVVTLEQVGGDVVASGNGAIDVTGLSSPAPTGSLGAQIEPALGLMVTRPAVAEPLDAYFGLTGPASFGIGSPSGANSGSGDTVAINGFSLGLGLPPGYINDSVLLDTATYTGQTFSSLGVTPGRYEWTWGDGANQNLTLVIGEVPEPSTWAMMLLGFAGLGLVGCRRRRAGLA
ncbi:MAG TPA: PEP-CTERM sorting domain-containing protein [Roseiarcus sp.]